LTSEEQWQNIPGEHAAYDQFLRRIEKMQQPILAQYGCIKKWSREVFLAIIAEDLGMDIKADQIEAAIHAFWNRLTQHVEIIASSRALLETIQAHRRPIYIATSSDGRLQMQSNGQFIYDPVYSRQLKRKRIEALRSRGLFFSDVYIGDPEDKPQPVFFEKMLSLAEKNLSVSIDTRNCIMVGDSLNGDIRTPRDQMHFGLTVHFKPTQSVVQEEEPNYILTPDIREVLRYLS
jgi:FMN phosphatase YigB (HAD superfamily)